MARIKKINTQETVPASKFQSLIESRYGEDIIQKDEDIPLREIHTIPTGSISLDISTGIGGIPRGRFTEIFGMESAAKTSLCLSISKQALKQGLRVLYVEPENTLDYKYIEAIVGTIDKANFVLAQSQTAEQTLSICEAGIESNEFQLIILDSIGALLSDTELKEDLEKSHYAGISKLLTLFLKRNAFEVRKKDIAFIFVNQVRDNIGNPYAGVFTPGGHALKHFLAMRIKLNRQDTIEVVEDKDHKEQLGINSRYSIAKNKLARPFRSFYFPFYFSKGIDEVEDTINFAEMLRILDKKGSYYYFEGENLGQGVNKTKLYLLEKSNAEILNKIKLRCHETILKSESTIEEEEETSESFEEV
jgi:recombination protein RecA